MVKGAEVEEGSDRYEKLRATNGPTESVSIRVWQTTINDRSNSVPPAPNPQNVPGVDLKVPVPGEGAGLTKGGSPVAIHPRLGGHTRRVGGVGVDGIVCGAELEVARHTLHIFSLED